MLTGRTVSQMKVRTVTACILGMSTQNDIPARNILYVYISQVAVPRNIRFSMYA
jgi:2-keto-4-pentenoate hydratase/2-oxohepta-3-ene-1,7-dioic acid hydratase in catechol pathway